MNKQDLLFYIRKYYIYFSLAILIIFSSSSFVRKQVFRVVHTVSHGIDLNLKTLHLSPTRHTPVEYIISSMNIETDKETNMLDIDINKSKKLLETSNFIEEAIIIRSFPNTISVFIKERTPVGIWQHQNTKFLIDAKGLIIQEYKKTNHDLWEIEGINTPLYAAKIFNKVHKHDLTNRIKKIKTNYNGQIEVIFYNVSNNFVFAQNLSISENTENLIKFFKKS